jgi:Fe-S-cluster containining protein
MEFNCVKDCSQCCIEREYYPSKKFGKVGVLILPDEKAKIETLAKKIGINIQIIPRIGISNDKFHPEKIIAYQMMGKDDNGNTCPFLDTQSESRSPHGGFTCRIYNNRPLACMAYPLIETDPIMLDQKCKFCQTCPTADSNLNSEIESLVKIKNKMNTNLPIIWRYATGIGEQNDKLIIEKGWICE